MSALERVKAAIPPKNPEMEQTCEVGDADLRALVRVVEAVAAVQAHHLTPKPLHGDALSEWNTINATKSRELMEAVRAATGDA